MSDSFRNDPQWRADYEAAFAELQGLKPDARFLNLRALPTPDPVPQYIPAAQPPEPGTRQAVLRALVIKRTVQPRVRDVYCEGTLVGKILNAGPLRWMASTRRGECFTSMVDASLALWLDSQP